MKEAYQKNPMDVNVLYYLAKASARTSWKKEGVEYMEEAFRIAVPSDSMMVRLYDGLVECYDYAGDTKKEVEALEKLYIYTKKNSILYKIACLYDWKEDEKNAIRYYRKYMATVPEDQRYALDEDGNPVEDRITLYQQAWKRIKKIKEEGFFRGDIPTKSFPVEKKDTLALRHAK
jgi:tetratricopeptide (TPR) repeat protein